MIAELHDDKDIAARVETIMSTEPLDKKTAANFDFAEKLCNAAHGTNLAAALSALRNTSGQLVPINQLGETLWASGATPEPYLEGEDRIPLRNVVFAADILHFGKQAFETAERYARCEARMEPKLKGSRAIHRSEASLIPALLLGELVDPKGIGAKLNVHFQNPTQSVVDSVPADNPLYGKTVEQFKAVFEDQIIGERFKVHGIFVAHPTDARKDARVLELATRLVQASAIEQRCDYSGIRVGLLRQDIDTFKEQIEAKGEVTSEDIHRALFQ